MRTPDDSPPERVTPNGLLEWTQPLLSPSSEASSWRTALLKACLLLLLVDALPHGLIGDFSGLGLRWLLGTAVIVTFATVGINLAPRFGIDPCPLIDVLLLGRRYAKRACFAAVTGIALGVGQVVLLKVLVWSKGWHVDAAGVEVTHQMAAIFFNLAGDEEIEFRLFLLTGLCWLATAVFRPSWRPTRDWLLLSANLTQAIIFGWGHLAEGGALSDNNHIAIQIMTAPAFWGGLIEGYLYVGFGIESAIMCHTIFDLYSPSHLGIP
jgi:hypothetical protein